MSHSEQKVYVVTGASQGIGLETARQLAETGAKVLITTRTEEKGESAINNILSTFPDADVEFYVADMSRQKDIRAIAADMLRKYDRINGLVNNVGTWMSEYKLTDEGIETVFATNHLSYFLMTHLLYPVLQNAEQGRVVNVASNAHSYGKINLQDPGYSKNYHGLRSNGQSKLANLYFTFELHAQRPDEKVSTFAVSPGLVKTDIGLKHTSWLHSVAWKLRRRKGQHPSEGARTSVYCAIEESIHHQSGKYWESKVIKEVFPSALDPHLGKGLWDLSRELCGIDDFFKPR